LRVVGVGIDIVDLAVFRRRLEAQDGLPEELFLPSEIEYCTARARPWESYAARFAAKEAAFKALGRGLSQGLRWKQVEVLREDTGAVGLRLSGAALAAAGELGADTLQLSMSHSGENAIAIVIALAGHPPAADTDSPALQPEP
jgi:holo-[acyl-carrier protein] synthase